MSAKEWIAMGAGAVVGMVLVGRCQPAHAGTPSAVYERQVETTVRIEVRDMRGVAVGTGSGVVVAADGLVVTAAHVLGDVVAAGGSVVLEVGRRGAEVPARVVLQDDKADVAVLRVARAVDAPKHHAMLCVRACGAVGTSVVSIGSPMGVPSPRVATGVVASEAEEDAELGHAVAYADIAALRGSSGSALFDMRGRVVGLVEGYIRDRGQATQQTFFVPARAVREVVQKARAQEATVWDDAPWNPPSATTGERK